MGKTINDFLNQHGFENFNHRNELISGLETQVWNLSSYTGGEKNRMQANAFVEIYGRKARQLSRRTDEYSKELLNELIDFCKALEKLDEEIIDIWSFSDGTCFLSVFVQRTTEKIVATLKTKS